jgi:hypothetical protein
MPRSPRPQCASSRRHPIPLPGPLPRALALCSPPERSVVNLSNPSVEEAPVQCPCPCVIPSHPQYTVNPCRCRFCLVRSLLACCCFQSARPRPMHLSTSDWPVVTQTTAHMPTRSVLTVASAWWQRPPPRSRGRRVALTVASSLLSSSSPSSYRIVVVLVVVAPPLVSVTGTVRRRRVRMST